MKFKPKSLTVVLVTLFLLSTLAGTQLIGNVSAAIPYTEYTGTLGGADWALRIPDPWNGMLLVLCRGYSPGGVADIRKTALWGRASAILDQGFAIAGSTYGSAGFCIQKGVDSTYQLTNYIISTYHVAGKVFLTGLSLGGTVALLLGEKYPNIYSGVLELYGTKDLKWQHATKSRWANLTDEELAVELAALGIPVPPHEFSTLEALRSWVAIDVAAIEQETGGTPTTNPTAYEDRSPTYHANIMIPVITVHDREDGLVPFYESIMYQNAVTKAYRSHLYRLYDLKEVSEIEGHVLDEVPPHFAELVEWSNELTGAHDWPMLGYDAQRSGYTTSSGPNTNQTLWTYTMDGFAGTHPAVVNDKLYVGDWMGNVYCLDAATGAKIWNYTTGEGIYSDPAVIGGKLYLGSGDDSVYCLDAVTGAKIWSYKTGDEIVSSPVIANGKVYIGSKDGKLYCFRADLGQVEWQFTTGGMIELSSPAVADGKVYIGSNDHKLYCLDAATSELIWSYTTGDNVSCSPAVADGKVYVGSYDDNVYCLDAVTGAKIWSYTTGDDITYSCPAIAYGKVYVGSVDENVYCLDAETGVLIWNYATSGAVWAAPTVADGKVYVGSYGGSFYCLDAEIGALIWSYRTTLFMLSSPVVANGVAYGVSGNHVHAFSAWAPIPEGLTLGVMLLLSTIAVIVSMRYYRKRPKWKNW